MLGLVFAFQNFTQSPKFFVGDLAVAVDIILVPSGVKPVVVPIVVFPFGVTFVLPKVCLTFPELNLVHSSVLVNVILVDKGLSFGLAQVCVVLHDAEALKGLIHVSVGIAIDVKLRPEGVETLPALLVGADYVVELKTLNHAI